MTHRTARTGVETLHTQTESIRDWTRKESSPVSNMKKGCPTAPPVQTVHGETLSLIIGLISVHSVYLSLSTPPEVLKKRESRSVYTMDAFYFSVKNERGNAA
ncbi:Hypothetical predicted protein [Xyrichtys novacula]|uniref:PiggyBac transposable element-derived protein domain-containing protein n=1 Tax=Xyrichtys novacula TaxID=13765 RepID=A0AAV1GNV6_XYRNO|nr:Hypothetical predicted protein [Xyrichtys novacula]